MEPTPDRAPRAPDAGTGEVLSGRYRLEEQLGAGATAAVWRATDLDLGRTVAVKVLRQGDVDAELRARFEREAAILGQLDHPNLVRVLAAGTDGDRSYTVVEHIAGRSLHEALERGGFEVDEALDIALQVSRGLARCHEAGVLHRDIKPGNVMLADDGTAKLVDFGIARSSTLTTLTQGATVLGTASYLSPEQAQALPLDARSDVYSLGCLLYELLTGRPPFQAPSPVAVAYKHVHEEPEPPSTHDPAIPAELEAVILCALAKDPEARYPGAAELAADLERVRAGEAPLLAGGPGATTLLAPGAGEPTTVLPAEATAVLPAAPGMAGGAAGVAAAGAGGVAPASTGRSGRPWTTPERRPLLAAAAGVALLVLLALTALVLAASDDGPANSDTDPAPVEADEPDPAAGEGDPGEADVLDQPEEPPRTEPPGQRRGGGPPPGRGRGRG